MKNYLISIVDIKNLINNLDRKDWNIIAPNEDNKSFCFVEDTKKFSLSSNSSPTKISFKEYFFPKTETLFYFKKNGKGIELTEPSFAEKHTLVLGAKPCDAASLPILSKVFNWDYQDEFFNKRIENSVIVGIACSYKDENCFCTSVNLSPDSTKGSDLFMTPTIEGEFILNIVTEKGDQFFKKYFTNLKETEKSKPAIEVKLDKSFSSAEVKQWIKNNFENPIWDETGDLCIGCGQCAFVCPTCHCFDIVDENCDINCGRRVKNWDGCQFGLFTKHTSGHNPRESQDKRYRQRVSHKFSYYVDKFDEVLCTGCGRCSRGCPVGIDIGEIVQEMH